MLVTTQFLEQVVQNYVRPAILPIGIHLSLTLGKAVAPVDKVPDLVDAAGNFSLSAGELFSLFGTSRLAQRLLEQIRTEFDAQLALACDWGLKPTHADSHQHVHMVPGIYKVVEELLPRYGIHRLRYCRERINFRILKKGLFEAAKRNNLAKHAALRLCEYRIKPGLSVPDMFFGVFHSGMMSHTGLSAIVESIRPDQSIEIGIHPGFPSLPTDAPYPTRPSYNDFIRSPARQIEHDLLVADGVRDLITRCGLIIRDYRGCRKD